MLVSETMRPSSATEQWHDRLAQPDVSLRIAGGMTKLAVVEAPNSEMEALAIAVAMREARHLNKSAALVTPDRALARRVMAALRRWNLEFDDSGGDALMDTPSGIFARLAAEAASKGLEPPTLLALLKHPLFRLGGAPGAFKHAIETLELALLRGTRPQAGTAGLARDFDRFRVELRKLRSHETSSLHASEPRAKLRDDELDQAQALIAALQKALAPLEVMGASKPYDFAELALRHRETLIALSSDQNGVAIVFEETQGAALSAAFDDLLAEQKPSGLMVQLGDYPDVFQTAYADRMVRRPESASAQLHIYGQLEARLTESDRVILGGLVEGVWPPAPRVDPWLSRPMRHELGLDLPERRIGLSAHDFAQLLGTDDVILTHSAKVGGAPAVASRFLHRLEAVAGEARWDAAKSAGENYVRFAAELDQPDAVEPIAAARAKTAGRDAADEIVGHGDRGLAARSLYDLREIYSAARSARPRRHAAVGGRSRLGDPWRARRVHAKIRRRAPATARTGAARHRRKIFRAADGASRGAGAVVAAVSAHRQHGLPIGSWRGATKSRKLPPRSGARSKFRSTTSASSRCRRAPTGSSSAATAALRSSITRPASRRRENRCAWACRRN